MDNLTALEVQTYVSEGTSAMPIDVHSPSVKATLKAYTRVDLAGNTVTCVPVSSGGAVDEALWAMHQKSVDSAVQRRLEVVKMVLDLARIWPPR